MDVGSWLRSLGLEIYEQAFRDNKIDGEVLPNLTAEDLKDLGVVLVGDRRRLLTAIAALREANAAVPKPSSVQVGPSLQAQPSSSDAERRQLTLMFCDLVGSTALSTELDPEDLRELINTYHTYCAERVTRFGGYVAKYMGDGVLAYFGYPEAHEDDAIRAINSGLSILNEIGSLPTRADYKPQIRVGIATGLVVVGDLIGQGSAQERNVVGETPNLAARLQSVAEPGTVVIAASTHQVARGLFEYRDIGELHLKGFGQPVHAWQVLGASDLQSRFEAFQTSGVTPLVGREEELTLLVRRWAQAQSSGGRAVLLTGEPGIGKSRITAAFCQQLEAGKHSRVRYFCSAHHQDSALHPIVAQLERAAGFARLDTPEAKVEKLKALFAFTGASNEDLALVAELLSLPNAVNDVAVRDMVPQRKRQKIFDALLHQLKTLASHRPLLIIFEDVHWIDPTSLELLAMMIEQAQQLPMLLLVTARPGFTPPWPSYAHMTTVQLTRLSRDEGAALIRRVTEGKNLPTEVMDQILARTDGVPLFVEELTKMVLESTLLREQAGAYVLTSPLLTLAIPATLHDSLLARLNRLAPVMNFAQIGAAIGREFSHEVLSAVAGLPTDECAEALDRLVRSELVFRRGTLQEAVYTFKHALVRDAVYGTLLRNKRQELHARIAHTLEERFPEIVTAQPERLAQHCADAGLVEKAITYWHRAGKQALARSATAEAMMQLRKGLALLTGQAGNMTLRHKELEFDLQVALGSALMAAKGYAHVEVVEAYERARSLAVVTGRAGTMLNFSVLWGLCTASYVAGKSHAALAQAKELLLIAKAQTESGPLVIAHGLVGCTQIMNGDYQSALQHLEQAVELYEPVEHRRYILEFAQDIGVRALCYLSLALWHRGFPDQATKAASEALRYAKESMHAHTIAYALFFGAMTAVLQRRATEVEERATASIDLAKQHGFALWLGRGQILQGWVMAQRGAGITAVECIHEGLSKTAATGSALWRPFLSALLAEALGRARRMDEALTALTQGFAAAADSGQIGSDAELHRLRGQLLRNLPDPDWTGAESSFRSSIAIARQQGSRGFELRAAVDLARLLADQGRRGEALDVLAPVYGGFREGFEMPDLIEGKTLLNGLS